MSGLIGDQPGCFRAAAINADEEFLMRRGLMVVRQSPCLGAVSSAARLPFAVKCIRDSGDCQSVERDENYRVTGKKNARILPAGVVSESSVLIFQGLFPVLRQVIDVVLPVGAHIFF